jgi:hypothetical protein
MAFLLGTSSTPTFADLDGDGDLDAVIEEDDVLSTTTKIRAVAAIPFTRSKQEPPTPSMAFLLGISAPPPLPIWTQMATSMPLLGKVTAVFNYYKNTGSSSNPAYAEQTRNRQPLQWH